MMDMGAKQHTRQPLGDGMGGQWTDSHLDAEVVDSTCLSDDYSKVQGGGVGRLGDTVCVGDAVDIEGMHARYMSQSEGYEAREPMSASGL